LQPGQGPSITASVLLDPTCEGSSAVSHTLPTAPLPVDAANGGRNDEESSRLLHII
jgi:hypothetical protein